MTQTVIPQLRITDAQRSRAFYLDALGFSLDWTHQFEPGYPVFMQITRQGQTLFLTQHSGDCQTGGAVYFIVPDAQACHDAFVARGALPTNPLADTPWGTREFLMTDPDGNRLRFAQNL
jgi:catechol 2,3-dioxygenase-like lactoylglutathione lyase family enzyme